MDLSVHQGHGANVASERLLSSLLFDEKIWSVAALRLASEALMMTAIYSSISVLQYQRDEAVER
jgi:hypothetical protein